MKITITLCTALLLVPAVAPAQTTLDVVEVKAMITDRTVDIQNLSTGLHFRAFYAASGEMIVQRADAVEISGRWSVRPDGALCVYFDVESCGGLSKNADGTYTRIVGGKPAFTWFKVAPGKGF